MRRDDLSWSPVSDRELNIPVTLASGQSFRWRQTDRGDWIGAIGDLAVQLRPLPDRLGWRTLPEPGRWDVIAHYFALEVPIESLYEQWRRTEPRMHTVTERWRGLRILRQPAEEALVAFLCACCNTVVKIGRSVSSLASLYGRPLAEFDGIPCFAFPSIRSLAAASEQALRERLWGFRAPRVIEAAQYIAERPTGWLEELRRAPYREAHAAVSEIPGVGAKIADCVCLFGLWHEQAVPVDTHIRRIVTEWYAPELMSRSLTISAYRHLGETVRQRFGEYAGWAQQYLFWDAIAPKYLPATR